MQLNIYYFENLDLPEGGTTMTLLIWLLYAGLLIGSIFATFEKQYCSGFVSALRDTGADAPERAVLLNDLEIRGKWYLKNALKPGKALRKMVAVAGEESKVEGTRFYLPEEKRVNAELRYENGKKPIRALIFSAILLTVVALVAQFILPELLTMLDNLVGSL